MMSTIDASKYTKLNLGPKIKMPPKGKGIYEYLTYAMSESNDVLCIGLCRNATCDENAIMSLQVILKLGLELNVICLYMC